MGYPGALLHITNSEIPVFLAGFLSVHSDRTGFELAPKISIG